MVHLAAPIFPDAPRGWALLSRPGFMNVATELVVFSPRRLRPVAADRGMAVCPNRRPQSGSSVPDLRPSRRRLGGRVGLEAGVGREGAASEAAAGLEGAGLEAAAGLAPTPDPAPRDAQ